MQARTHSPENILKWRTNRNCLLVARIGFSQGTKDTQFVDSGCVFQDGTVSNLNVPPKCLTWDHHGTQLKIQLAMIGSVLTLLCTSVSLVARLLCANISVVASSRLIIQSDRPCVRPTVRPSARPTVRPSVRPSRPSWRRRRGRRRQMRMMRRRGRREGRRRQFCVDLCRCTFLTLQILVSIQTRTRIFLACNQS